MSKQVIQQVIAELVANTDDVRDLQDRLRRRIMDGVCAEESFAYSSALLRLFAMVYGDESAAKLKELVEAGYSRMDGVPMSSFVRSLPKKEYIVKRSLDLDFLIPMTLMYFHHMRDSIPSHLGASAEGAVGHLFLSGTYTEDEAFETVRTVFVEELSKHL